MTLYSSAIKISAAILLVGFSPALITAQEKSEPIYGQTPEELLPFRKAGEPYTRFFTELPSFRGPGRDELADDGLTSVKIGLLMPFGGLDYELGQRFKQGVELAVVDANRTGGFHGLPFEIVIRDEAQAWGAAANAAVELAIKENVWALIGAFDDASTHVLSRVLLKLELPTVNTSGTDPTLTEHTIPWMVRIRPDDRQNAYRLAQKIFLEDARQRVVVFRANDRYARTGIAELVDAARRLHHPIQLEVRFENHESDWPIQFERIRAIKPDALVLWGRAEPSGRVLKGLRASGIDVPVYGPDRLADVSFISAAGAAAEGMVLTHPFDPSGSDDRWSDFRSHFATAYGREPDSVAGYGYDGARMLLQAISEAGLNRVLIRDRLFEIRELPGVTGPIRFDNTQNNVQPVLLCQIRDGQLVFGEP